MTPVLIAAQSQNRVIGQGLQIPWRVRGEKALFKRITLGGVLIMGRKTHEAIGRPLPGRDTIVVSRQRGLRFDGCCMAASLDEAMAQAGASGKPVFIVGGGEIYRQSIHLVEEVHLTTVHAEFEGDVFFPELPGDFTLVKEEVFRSSIDYTYRYYARGGGLPAG